MELVRSCWCCFLSFSDECQSNLSANNSILTDQTEYNNLQIPYVLLSHFVRNIIS